MKLSPVSVPYRAIQKVSGLFVIAFFLATSGTVVGPIAIGLGVLAVVVALAYELAYFQRFDYELTHDTFDVRSGVVSRREREIPYGRIQNVDISRNVVQRLLGIAALDLETAGGSSTEGAIRYVDAEEADRLQRQIQQRKARAVDDGRRERDGEAADSRRTDPEPIDETELFSISPSELALVGALSFDPRLIGLLAFLASGSFPVLTQFLPELDALVVTITGLILVGALLAGSWILGVVAAVTNYYGFRLSRSGDELRYERGLLRRYSGSIPFEKVQTLSIEDNPLKRPFDYATLAIETAGYAPGQGGDYGSQAAVPLAKTDRVLALAHQIEEFGTPEFERPPKRIRWRYVARYAIALGALVAGLFAIDWYFAVDVPWYYPIVLGLFIPPAAHLKWAHRGYWLGDEHVVTRYGFWNRRTKVVPYYRIQTVIDTRTVFQRRWNVATVHVDTAGSRSIGGGGAAALDIDEVDAAELRDELNSRLQTALAERRSERQKFQWTEPDETASSGAHDGDPTADRSAADRDEEDDTVDGDADDFGFD